MVRDMKRLKVGRSPPQVIMSCFRLDWNGLNLIEGMVKFQITLTLVFNCVKYHKDLVHP